MRDLYKALAHLTLDQHFRDNVVAAADKKEDARYHRGQTVPNTDTPEVRATDIDLKWEVQPDYAALKKIDILLRAKDLFLSAYEIAEINRWAMKKTSPTSSGFATQMAAIGKYLTDAGITADNAGDRELTLIGALIVDEDVRSNLRKGPLDKEWFGFTDDLTDTAAATAIQDKLRPVFPDNLMADKVAREFFNDGWSKNGCPARAYLYQSMFHFNV